MIAPLWLALLLCARLALASSAFTGPASVEAKRLFYGPSLPVTLVHLQPGMPLTQPWADARLQEAARALLQNGPIVAARRGEEAALIPLSISAGAQAAVLPAAGAAGQARLVTLTAEVAAELRGYLGNADAAGANQALARAFDALRRPPAETDAAEVPAPAKAGAGNRLTLERVYEMGRLKIERPSQPLWSSDSRYVTYRDGKGQLWAYDWEKKTRAVWVGKADWNYRWSQKGDALLYSADGQWTLFDVAARTARGLGQTKDMSGVLLSPDGKMIAFERDEQIWVKPVDGGEERQLTQGRRKAPPRQTLRKDMNPAREIVVDHFAWSPDSSRIAHLDYRKAEAGTFPLVDYAPARGKVEHQSYVMPGEELDTPLVGVAALDGLDVPVELPPQTAFVDSLQWTPQGKLALAAVNRERTKRVIQIDGRAAQTDEDPAWVSESLDLTWLPDGRPVYLSERTGHRHIEVDGKTLTSGDWNVHAILGVDDVRGEILYMSSEGDRLQSHLWRVSARTGERRRLTSAPGWHHAIVSPDGSRFVDDWSSVETPDVMQPLQDEPEDLGAQPPLPKPEFLKIPSSDGQTPLDATLLRPPQYQPGRRYPVIVYSYGGSYSQNVKNAWNRNFLPWHQMMAQRGFFVLVVDNRLSGAGRTDVIRKMHKKLGAIEVLDLRSAFKWLKTQPWADGRRIGHWGWSYGGYMTLMAMTRLKDIRAGVAVAPVTDWRLYNLWYTENRLGKPQDEPRAYRTSSPVHQAKSLSGRLMIVHGLYDDNVHFQHTDHMITALDDAGKRYDLRAYPGQRHGISRRADWMNLFDSMTEFFLRYLRK